MEGDGLRDKVGKRNGREFDKKLTYSETALGMSSLMTSRSFIEMSSFTTFRSYQLII